MSLPLTASVIAGIFLLALVLAYLPMRLLVAQMARSVTAPIRQFIQRQRDRRTRPRQSPDRRKTASS